MRTGGGWRAIYLPRSFHCAAIATPHFQTSRQLFFFTCAVQASIASNTYVVSGTSENKSAEEVAMGMAMSAGSGLAGINPAQLKALQEALKASGGNLGAAGLGGGDAADEDEGLPELEGDFEASA